jgi:hypothetical protein
LSWQIDLPMNTEHLPSFGIGSNSVMATVSPVRNRPACLVGKLWVSAADEPTPKEPAPWPARGPCLDNTAMASGSLFEPET